MNQEYIKGILRKHTNVFDYIKELQDGLMMAWILLGMSLVLNIVLIWSVLKIIKAL